jgi:hypothetical protein
MVGPARANEVMQQVLVRTVTLLLLFFVSAGSTFAQVPRVALVIGNAKYKHTPPLANPTNDAADFAAELRKLGFAVIEKVDLDKASMDRAIRDFAEKLGGAKVGLFFYAGHGLQVGGQNYLVPIDAMLASASAIDFEMVRLDLVHRTMERETSTNILMMDACRDNPLARNLARALGTRSTQVGRGLALVESGEGTLISFSTQPGNVALDGTGRNSPYAAALLKHLTTPGDDLPTILINVRKDVMKATGRRQVPWEHSAMTAKFYFTPPKEGPKEVELQFWASVKDSTSPSVLRTYVERFPDGEFVPIARALIEHYEQRSKAEAAAREEAARRREEERKAAEVKRLEEDGRAKDAALSKEKRQPDNDRGGPQAKLAEDKRHTEQLAHTKELRKALEEVRIAREAATKAEHERLAALNAAQDATKAAEKAIEAKREAEKSNDPQKLAALPKLDVAPSSDPNRFDGAWQIVFTWNEHCPRNKGPSPLWTIKDGKLHAQGPRGAITGTVSPDGDLRVQWHTPFGPKRMNKLKAKLQGKEGKGTWQVEGFQCGGTVNLSQM